MKKCKNTSEQKQEQPQIQNQLKYKFDVCIKANSKTKIIQELEQIIKHLEQDKFAGGTFGDFVDTVWKRLPNELYEEKPK